MTKHWTDFWKQWDERRGQGMAWRDFFREFLGTPLPSHWVFGGRRFKPWHMGEMAFNPFVATMLSKGGGLLPLYVLHLLSREERYGNELMQEIAERTHHRWAANPGAIYPLLTVLEESGFIEGEWEDPDKRTVRRYRITPAGAEELARIKAVMRPRLKEAIEVMRDMVEDLDDREEKDNA
ncbi:MAG: PadR family transcriptional regulator [Anaerolineae bacterium]|nr:PadR family transcriptional regulator [Anaerolineae bacterium]